MAVFLMLRTLPLFVSVDLFSERGLEAEEASERASLAARSQLFAHAVNRIRIPR